MESTKTPGDMFAKCCNDCFHVASTFVNFHFLSVVSVTLYALGGNMLSQVDLEMGCS